MSSSRSLRPWPRRCTTPHEDRGRPRPGRRRASCTTRPSSGRLLLPSRCSSVCTKKSPAGGGLPPWHSRRGRRSGYSDTPWSMLADVAPMVPSLAVPEPQMVDQLVAMVSSTSILWCPSRLSQCPRSPGHPAFLVRFSVSRRRRNSWWKCLSLLTSFSDFVRWEETYRRTGHTWLVGFEWCLTTSPGRYINTGPGPRRRPWYRAASVPVHRQSGGNPWLRLSRQLRTVQTVQFWGVRSELQRQVPAVSQSVVNFPVILQRRRSWVRGALFDSGYMFCVSKGDFWKNFWIST